MNEEQAEGLQVYSPGPSPGTCREKEPGAGSEREGPAVTPRSIQAQRLGFVPWSRGFAPGSGMATFQAAACCAVEHMKIENRTST